MIEKVIEDWILKTLQDDSWKNHNDLHIDEISETFADSKKWIKGTLQCFSCAKQVRDSLKLPIILEAVIPLNSKKEPIGVNFDSIKGLQSELSWTPPSLYLYKKDYYLFQKGLNKATKIILNDLSPEDECYYYESLTNDDPDYYRSVSLVSEP